MSMHSGILRSTTLERERIKYRVLNHKYLRLKRQALDVAAAREKEIEDSRREKERIARQRHLASDSSLINQFTETKNRILDATVLGNVSSETASKMGVVALASLMALYLVGRID
jgi:hypothetical protein